jgi:hypothetical protein
MFTRVPFATLCLPTGLIRYYGATNPGQLSRAERVRRERYAVSILVTKMRGAEVEASSIVYRAAVYHGNANVRFVRSVPYYDKTEFARHC